MVNPSAPLPPWRHWLPWLALGGFWVAGIAVLSNEWRVNPQYRFGWAVPVLCAWLFVNRWRDRPIAQPANGPSRWLIAIGGALLPVRVGLEAFPDWRPLLWLLAIGLVALALGLLHEAGGTGWRRHFTFPVAFLLTAVPWPTPVESFVVHGLMRLNATLAVDLLTLFGQPAVQRGGIIEVGRGLVGVDEACSGIRSLQAALMLSLLVGEFFRLRGLRRAGLIVSGAGLALLTNLGRTLWLVSLAAREGPVAIAGAHDEAGLTTMLACVVGLGWFGWCWRDRSPAVASPEQPKLRAVSFTSAAWLVVLVVLGEVGTALWYRRGDDPTAAAAVVPFAWPEPAAGFRELVIRPAVRTTLGIDDGRAAAWSDPSGAHWTVHWLRWEPRPVRQAILAKYHTPDICLPAAGCLLREELGPLTVTTAKTSLRFRGYSFEENGAPLFVFFLLHEDRSAGHAIASVARERLRLIWEGRRHTGQTELHVALRGVPESAAAIAAFQREIAPRLTEPR